MSLPPLSCLLALLLLLITNDRALSTGLPPIKVTPDGQGFVAGEQPFRPFGFNYDRDYRMRLLEDYWEAEWTTVQQDFREMKDLGANVVRVHLQFSAFMSGPRAHHAGALRQLKKLLRLAEQTGLYLDLTGLASYRKQAVPDWYRDLNETDRWAAQAEFWTAIARTCRHSPAVFCYNLMNEPIVPKSARPPGDWLVGELAGFWYVQAISLNPAGRPRTQIAAEWTARMAAAIRAHDTTHLITVGLLPNSHEGSTDHAGFTPQAIAASVDFFSVHLYPAKGKLEQDLQTLAAFGIGKPVVIEELFPLTCSSEELLTFLSRSRKSAHGWLSFYWGQTPSDLSRDRTMAGAVVREWILRFSDWKRE